MYQYKLLGLLLLIALSSCQSPDNTADPTLSKYDITQMSGIGHDKAVLSSKDGEILEEGFVLNGQKDGQWVYYNPKGKFISKVENYSGGKLHGVIMEFNNRREMTSSTEYAGGLKEGYHVQYQRSRPKLEAFYKDGKLHGRLTKYQDYSSDIQSETDYKDGKQDGIYRYYDDEGNITLDYLYKDGEKIKGGIVE